MSIDLEKDRRETMRWLILRPLEAGGSLGCGEALIRATVDGEIPDGTAREIRTQLDYLERRELVTISGRDRPTWIAKLTRIGTDVVEYTVPCDPGIDRPTCWNQ